MSMPKEEIIGMVLEMYDARKEAKEYLEFYANPDENGKLEEYKKIITEEFYPSMGRQEPKTRFSVCRKAVSDYKKLKPSPDKLADLMLCYVENACQFTYDYGDMWEQYYTSVENNFEKTMAVVDMVFLTDLSDGIAVLGFETIEFLLRKFFGLFQIPSVMKQQVQF